jgi:hypothetical protein
MFSRAGQPYDVWYDFQRASLNRQDFHSIVIHECCRDIPFPREAAEATVHRLLMAGVMDKEMRRELVEMSCDTCCASRAKLRAAGKATGSIHFKLQYFSDLPLALLDQARRRRSKFERVE